MRILLLGKNGQLGWELNRSLATLGEVEVVDYPQIDMASAESIWSIVVQSRPQVIVNATAYTAVDRAESEPALAMAINGMGPGVLAELAKLQGALLVHYSTDYVFDGGKGSDYIETDEPRPLNVYGRSKLAGEAAVQAVGGAHLILRTAWVYSLRGESFVRKVLGWARSQERLRIVADQVSNPTWARLLAEVTAQVLARGGEGGIEWLGERSGIYHVAGDGRASRLDWAQAVLELEARRGGEAAVRVVEPAKTADFPTPAQRPLYSALNCERFRQTFGLCLPPWRVGLELAMSATD
jgi:dTDP-4-dehydrorhamnose reductase